MMIKQLIKKAINNIFSKRPIYTTTNIVSLGPNELIKDRFALITGGTSGIGFAIAQTFLSSGASVCITGRTESKIKESCNQLLSMSANYTGKVYGIVLDNKNIDSFEDKFKSILKMGKVDILVNNAGVLGGVLPNATEDDFDSVIDTNLKGVFFLSQMVGKYMKENNIKGNILNIGSSSCLRPAVSAYTISKWGIRGLTMGLAKSLAHYNITVNGLAPGPTATPMLIKGEINNISLPIIPAGRYIMPEEIANMALVLVSDMGKMIIGDIVYMTGGAGILTYEDMNYSF